MKLLILSVCTALARLVWLVFILQDKVCSCVYYTVVNRIFSGTKNEPKPKLLSPDIFRWGRGLPHEGVGAKKFGMPLETREIKLFWWDIPGFCRDILGVPEKFEKKKFGFNFRSLFLDSRNGGPGFTDRTSSWGLT